MIVMVKAETRQRKPATTEAFGRRRAVSRSVHSQPSVGKQNQLRRRRRRIFMISMRRSRREKGMMKRGGS